MSNYKKTHVTDTARTELHDTLGLTGAEISINTLDAGASVPFVHFHKNNEEIYGITSGNGRVIIDGEEIELTAGDWIRISPSAKRQFFASQSSPLNYICIQVKENSLAAYTMSDAEVVK
jgi:mannose-6-phosphate isomerase-like protein (cupin superfamily)